MQRSSPTTLTAEVLSVGLSAASCGALAIDFMNQFSWLPSAKVQHTQHAFVGLNDGEPAAYPGLSFAFLIRGWMWLFMGYICAQLNYINSSPIFHLNVKDVKRSWGFTAHVVGTCEPRRTHSGTALLMSLLSHPLWSPVLDSLTEFLMSEPHMSSS